MLRQHIDRIDQFFFDRDSQIRLTGLDWATTFGTGLSELKGRSVLVATSSQLTSALALIELDGVARRLTILPPDVDRDHLSRLIIDAEIDALVFDNSEPPGPLSRIPLRIKVTPELPQAPYTPFAEARTEWVLLTSGTTGVPKLVVHSLDGLTAAIAPQASTAQIVWGTFYDIRRYGGLQMFLRASLAGASLIFSSAGEPIADHLLRLARHGVTHLSGTPSHWRRALMSQEITKIAPRYVRLSGEIADQAVLDHLHATFPKAAIGHAYASTEAGVGFAVSDGLAGFPAAYFAGPHQGVELKVVEGSLHIRSPGTASRYTGTTDATLLDNDGFVDTGDIVERRGDRYFFVGRKGGIVNVGGLKVHPEEVEAAINQHPQVRMSLVRAKPNPLTGSVVIAEVVLEHPSAGAEEEAEIKSDILSLCRESLPRHKVPASISIVPAIAVAPSGKLMRHG